MNSLIYFRPAKFWHEALPLGNGKTAVMVYGGKSSERLCFNDATFWSGYPQNHDRKETFENLQKARELIFQGKNSLASQFVKDNLYGNYSQAYMPLADLKIKFTSVKDSKNYKHSLDLETALFQAESGQLKRTCFVCCPDNVAVYRAESKERFGLVISASSKVKHSVRVSDKKLIVYGNAPDVALPNYLRTKFFPIRYNEKKAMAFCLATCLDTDGRVIYGDKSIKVTGAGYVNIYSVTGTGFSGYDKMPVSDCEKVISDTVKNLKVYDYEKVLQSHISDYKALYDRHKLVIGENSDKDVLSMLEKAKSGMAEAELISLLYNYGKYMTIAGSRNSQPLNLQGQWNHSVRPPWSSNLTTNINYEMNYWHASTVGLQECLKPFYQATKEIVERGQNTAKVNYGAKGFACNHNVDIWRNTSPVRGDAEYMYAPLCGAWIVNETVAHQLNGGKGFDKDTLYALEQSVLFILDYLTEKDGYLVTCPSASPELRFNASDGTASVDYAGAFEMSVIRRAFSYALESPMSEDIKQRIKEAVKKLYPYQECKFGLAEWHKEFDFNEKGHRHFSPLYGVYPGKTVGYYKDKELCKLNYKLFKVRTDNSHSSIGWSAAWAICLAGRFHDKETAGKTVNCMLAKSILKNLFDFHPPVFFQIDGNFGFVAGINELLVYEEDGIIELLPACTDQLKNGSVSGHIVNGIRLDFEWQNGLVIKFKSDKPVRLRNVNLSENAILENAKLV